MASVRGWSFIILRCMTILFVLSAMALSSSSNARAFDTRQARLIDEGFKVFTQEKFKGNGRTCGTCHIPEKDYALSPADIAGLSKHDHKIAIGGSNSTLENQTLVDKFALFNISDTTPGAPGNNSNPAGPFRTSMQLSGLALTTLNECPNATLIKSATTTNVPTAQVTTLTAPAYPFVVGETIAIAGTNVPAFNLFGGIKISAVIDEKTIQIKRGGQPILNIPDAVGGAVNGLPVTGAGPCSEPPNFVTVPINTGTRFIELGWAGDGSPNDSTVFTPAGTKDQRCKEAVDAANANPKDLTAVLRAFSMGAVRHHFARTDARVPGVDFRCPTNKELDAIAAFQQYLGRQYPSGTPLELAFKAGTAFPGSQMTASQPVVTFKDATVELGKDIYLDPHAGCQFCHFNAGASLSASSVRTEPFGNPPLPFPGRNENEEQNEDMLTNTTFVVPSTGEVMTGGLNGQTPVHMGADPGDGSPVAGREVPTGIPIFNVQSIIEAPRKHSFFHNGAFSTTLEDAISFYFTDPFAFNLNTAVFTGSTNQDGTPGPIAIGLPNPLPRGTGQPEAALPGGPALALASLGDIYFPSDLMGGQKALNTLGFFLRALNVVYDIADCERLVSDTVDRMNNRMVSLHVPVLNCSTDLSDVDRVIGEAQIDVPDSYRDLQTQARELRVKLKSAARNRRKAKMVEILGQLKDMRHSIATIEPELQQ